MTPPGANSERHRIDTWLKLVCLFRHRADATEACKGGHVRINGQRVKPAAVVREGDLVELFAGIDYRKVVVKELPETNVSKEKARTMYVDETPVREKIAMPPVSRERGTGRPSKKERRELDKIKR
jgi:ribosome-associated heat shock protein Hsp15